jgi:acetolactate synthase-1/3 small subunit
MSITGDPGKNKAFQSACAKFGILQVARTGKLALKREPVFSESRRRRVKLMDAMKEAKLAMSGLHTGGHDGGGEYETALASRIVRAVASMEAGAGQGLTLVLISAQLELFCPRYNPA